MACHPIPLGQLPGLQQVMVSDPDQSSILIRVELEVGSDWV